jgi:hypothetical protein
MSYLRNKFPARLLNDQRGMFGLSMTDFALALFIFIVIGNVCSGKSYELISVPTSGIFLLILSPIRLSKRRKFIRDNMFYYFGNRVVKNVYRK